MKTIDLGVKGLVDLPEFEEVAIIFDPTSAKSYVANNAVLNSYSKTIVDLTPAAIGPYVVPPVNLEEHLYARNVNMVTLVGKPRWP